MCTYLNSTVILHLILLAAIGLPQQLYRFDEYKRGSTDQAGARYDHPCLQVRQQFAYPSIFKRADIVLSQVPGRYHRLHRL